MCCDKLVELITNGLAKRPLPPEVKTLEEAYRRGILVALEARIRVNGVDQPLPVTGFEGVSGPEGTASHELGSCGPAPGDEKEGER